MEDETNSIRPIRAEWRKRLRTASNRATEQVADMGMADLRALRKTIQEEMDKLEERLPDPGPIETKGPMTAEEQAGYVQDALEYNELQVRKRIVSHELRRRALGSTGTDRDVAIPPETKRFAEVAWDVMGEGHIDTITAVFREVARRVEGNVHLTTVEKWLRRENPHHPEETDGSWTELRRAVLLASSGASVHSSDR